MSFRAILSLSIFIIAAVSSGILWWISQSASEPLPTAPVAVATVNTDAPVARPSTIPAPTTIAPPEETIHPPEAETGQEVAEVGPSAELDIPTVPDVLPSTPGIIKPRVGFKSQKADLDQPNIIGGEVTEEDAYPWAAALVKSSDGDRLERQYCGGALIHPEWVITAAHCTYRNGTERTEDSFNVVVGTNTLDGTNGQEIAIAEIIRHPAYDRATAHLDIAILRLAEPAFLPTIELGDVTSLGEMERASTMTIGWGKTEDGDHSNELRHVNVPFVDSEICRAAYADFGYMLTDAMICAGFTEGGQDACLGDSGGPLVVPNLEIESEKASNEWSLIGVVSWGKGCAEANAYGVYVDVGQIRDWIHSYITPGQSLGYVEVQSVMLDTELTIGRVQGNRAALFLPLIQ